MKNINFIPKNIILYFHQKLIETYGGTTGIRDEKLLDSALEQPKATYQGKYLHDNIYKMAAAYGYHLCNNHPFIDGNKRIALVAMDVFLQINGFEISTSEKNAYKIIIKLSKSELTKNELEEWLKNYTSSLS